MRYRIESPASRVSVRVAAGGPLAALGHNPVLEFRDVRGEVLLDPEAPASGSLRVVIRADGLSLVSQATESDRREIEQRTRQEVLEATAYPEITYECPPGKVTASGPLQLTLTGELTLHGVTRPQTVSARLFVTGDTVRAQGEATVRQSDYRIKPVTALGGLLKVKDEVAVTFDVVARLAADPEPAGARTG